MEAESIIQELKEIGIVALIKSVPPADGRGDPNLQLLVGDDELSVSREHLGLG
jgi:hypothetical protein